MARFTTSELADLNHTSRDAAYALVVYLREARLATKVGTVTKPAGTKGKGEAIYEADLDAVRGHLAGIRFE